MNHYDDPAFFAAYAQMPRSQHGLNAAGEWHQLEPLFPPLGEKDVLDLGCGYGWHCQYAADHGARSVLGIDESSRMIATAKRLHSHPGITYRICSLQEFDYPAVSFDVVISNLVLHYVEELEPIFQRVFQTLRPNGTFLINMEHPTFTAGVRQQFSADGTWPVNDYYHSGLRETEFLGHTIIKYHHTLTQILMGLIHSGFRLEAVEEAMPPAEWRAIMPEEMRRPMMLLIRAAKEGRS